MGRIAVSEVLRGSRVGHALLVALTPAARQRGDTSLPLLAQCRAEGFYWRDGFESEALVFTEAAIAHVKMVKHL